VAHDGVFISRRGPGEGVPIFMAAKDRRSSRSMQSAGILRSAQTHRLLVYDAGREKGVSTCIA
jgi:hypothetical protein